MKFLLIFIFLLPQWVAAQSTGVCDPVTEEISDLSVSNRLRVLIQDKDFLTIEREMSEKLALYKRGQYSDLKLFWDIKWAVKNQTDLESFFTDWLKLKPDSFLAHFFTGEYYSNLGFAKRGTSLMSGTSFDQIDAMKREHAKARTAFLIAEKLNPQSALPLAGLMHVDKNTLGVERTHELLAKANKVDPKNTAARAAALLSLPPKWGGSLEEMESVVEQAQKAKLASAKLRYLQYSLEMQKGDHFGFMTRQKTKALTHWKNATQLCRGPKAWTFIASTANHLKDWNLALDAVDKALQIKPNDAENITARGYAHEQMGNLAAAFDDYERASNLGYAWAQSRLGWALWIGEFVPKDAVRGKKLLEEAAAQGNESARDVLIMINRPPRTNQPASPQ